MWGKWEDVKSEYEAKVNDPWDWVTHFENAVARYTGAKHAIACDSASNGMKLCLNYIKDAKAIKIPKKTKISIPSNTYVSVPNQIILEGFIPVFEEKEWENHYMLGATGIIDAAVSFYEGMFSNTLPNDPYFDIFMNLSFHHRKILNIGRGGMILTNSDSFNEWARPMIYDGRKKYMNYEIDEFECVGWHMYMTPEDAQKGLEIFHDERIQSKNESVGSWKTYKDLTKQKIFRKYDYSKSIIKYNQNNDVILNNLKIEKYSIADYIFNLQHYKKSQSTLDINPSKWHEAFATLDLKSFNENVNFILYDDIESFKDYDTHPIISLLKFIFKNHGMSDRLKFYGNNLSHLPKNTNYTPIPFFIGDSSWQAKPITTRKFSKKFLFLAGVPKMVRCQILLFLDENNLLKDTYWSWNVNNKPIPPGFQKYYLLNSSKTLDTQLNELHVSKMHQIIPEYYDSFVNIISETFFYQGTHDDMHPTEKPIFLTEKTDKCFTAAQPFIVFSIPNYLKHLKELGFKTFDKWWDESYDTEVNENKRLQMLYDIILEINSWSYEKCTEVYDEMREVLHHNQVLAYELDSKHKKIKLTRDVYLPYISRKVPHLIDFINKRDKNYLI